MNTRIHLHPGISRIINDMLSILSCGMNCLLILYQECDTVCVHACLCSGAGTIFQQGGQDQPFPAGGLGPVAPAGSGAEPRRQADFDNNLLKMK